MKGVGNAGMVVVETSGNVDSMERALYVGGVKENRAMQDKSMGRK